jgi:hypothetical protein
MRAAANLVLAIAFTLLAGGCPQGSPEPGGSADIDPVDDGSAGGGSIIIDTAKTGILITTPVGAASGVYDLYDATGTVKLDVALDTGEIEEVDAGTYVLKRYFSEFVWASGVTVVPGAVTEIRFGALNVTAVAGSREATYDIWDAANTTVLIRAQSDNTIVPLPPGAYFIHEYFNDGFVWASSAQVIADQVTTIPLGAFQLTMGTDWANPSYDVYAADGVTLLARPKSANELVPLPAGSYVIFAYFSESFRYANIDVQAGAVTTFSMGAIQYNGGESSYDIYDASGTKLLVRPASRGDRRSVPPGTYVLKDYFSEVVLAAGVVVSAGAVTTVP